jgi:hypothetical protein
MPPIVENSASGEAASLGFSVGWSTNGFQAVCGSRSISEAVLQAIAALKREIAEIPLSADWQITRVIIDREPQMRQAIAKAEKTFYACVEGISVLAQAYIAIDETALGYQTMIRGLEELGQAG